MIGFRSTLAYFTRTSATASLNCLRTFWAAISRVCVLLTVRGGLIILVRNLDLSVLGVQLCLRTAFSRRTRSITSFECNRGVRNVIFVRWVFDFVELNIIYSITFWTANRTFASKTDLHNDAEMCPFLDAIPSPTEHFTGICRALWRRRSLIRISVFTFCLMR